MNKKPQIDELKASQRDWKMLRMLFIKVGFYEPELVREFVALDCLFQILNFYFGKRASKNYSILKDDICKLVSEWGAEDVLASDSTAEEVLEAFMLLGGSHKEQASLADLDTNHSSN